MIKLKSARTCLMAALLLGFFALLLVDPENVLLSGKKAVDLCLNIIIPSLLPFFVISRLILKTGAIHAISRLFKPFVKPLFNLPGQAAFPLITGWFSGYPAGAKYTADLYENGLLTKNEAQRLLAFCNNSGPLFIVGAVGTGFFKSPKLGIVLLVCHLLASISVGIAYGLISRLKGCGNEAEKIARAETRVAISGHMLTDAILDAMKVLLQICGTIIFFAVLVQALETAGLFMILGNLSASRQANVLAEGLKVFVAGSLEVTYGLYLLSASNGIPHYLKVLLTSFLCGFGGFSVHTQVTGLCPADLKLKQYFWGKLTHGVLAMVYTGLFLANGTIPVMTNASAPFGEVPVNILITIYILVLIACMIILIRKQPARKRQD
ncbi:MAG: sporulation protein [Thermoclostridium sp.]|nr:sporulation protein [Thermoclostridium sp.]